MNNVNNKQQREMVPGTKFHVRIVHEAESPYYIKYYINHMLVEQKVNSYPRSFSNVKVYASNPWYQESEDVFVLQGFKYGELN